MQGTGNVLVNYPAISTIRGELVLDPTATLIPARGAPPIDGNATVVQRPLASLSGSSDGNVLSTELHGPSGADFVTVLSLPTPTLTTVFGDLWLNDTYHLFADFGTLDPTRLHRWSLTHGPVPSGITVTMQTVLYNGNFDLSMPTVIAFP